MNAVNTIAVKSVSLSGIRQRALAGLLAGLLPGLICGLTVALPNAWEETLLISILLGFVFGLTVGAQVRTPGAGLIWGQMFGLLWWLVGSITLLPLLQGESVQWRTATDTPTLFHNLLAYWVGVGALLGLLYYGLTLWLARIDPASEATLATPSTRRTPIGQEILPPLAQALLIGALSGLLGSWVFAWGVDRAAFYPLVAQLIGSESMMVGRSLHYLIGAVIGISFGLLFQRDARRPGVGLIWGLNYGLLWWVLGPLTLMPWLLGIFQRADWSLATAQKFVPSLIAHILYGALVGWLCGLAGKLWEVLFVASDPLNRHQEGVGAQSVRAIGMGVAGGVVGGLLFTIVMAGVGALPRVAQLVGGSSLVLGFLVHLLISIVIGISYGLLFQREVNSYGSGLAWGMVYGFFWWVLGALTLFPLLLRQPPDWSLTAVTTFFPSLVGHLLYGAGLGLFFQFMVERYRPIVVRPHVGRDKTNLRSTAAVTPVAFALLTTTLLIGVLLPLLLSSGK